MKKNIVSIIYIAAIMCFAGCDKDDSVFNPIVPQKAVEGMFVINEGNFYSGIFGSLSFLEMGRDTMQNKLFQAVNGRALGETPNSGIVANKKLYVAGERIEVINADTLVGKSVAVIDDVTQPRCLATSVDGKFVFVSSYSGKVSKIDTNTDKVVAESEVVGTCLEGICCRGEYVYVCNAFTPGENYNYTYHTNVVKLNASDLSKVKDITVVCNPTTILTNGDEIFVQSMGNYADTGTMIQKIDSDDKVTDLHTGTYFSAYKNRLYIIDTSYDADWNSVTSYLSYNLTTDKVSTIGEDLEKTADITYPCNIAVNPKNGDIFISSLRLSEYGYGDYNSPGYIVRYNNSGKKLNSYDVGVSPKQMVFM